MSNKTLANICAKHGYPEVLVDTMKTIPTVTVNENDELTGMSRNGDDILIISDQPPNDADGRRVGTLYFQIQG